MRYQMLFPPSLPNYSKIVWKKAGWSGARAEAPRGAGRRGGEDDAATALRIEWELESDEVSVSLSHKREREEERVRSPSINNSCLDQKKDT